MRSDEQPIVKPEVLHLFEILQEVMKGRIRVPRFQRPYVWRRVQMLDLLDSIWKHFPVGSLLLWDLDADARYEWKERIGPHRIEPPGEGGWSMLLDGHQRVSTLVGTLWHDSPAADASSEDEDPGRWEVYFDASQAEGEGNPFIHLRPGVHPAPHYVPVRKLSETIDIIEVSGQLMATGDPDARLWVQRTQDVARSLAAYKLPVIRIQRTNLERAVEIFARLNTKGRAMSADQMFSALTYREGADAAGVFHLAGEIDRIMGRLERRGFGKVDRGTVLRSTLAVLDEDIYRTDWTRLGRKKRDDIQGDLPESVQKTAAALDRTIDFLHDIGVAQDRLLPYEAQIVCLAAFFSQTPKPTDGQRRFLDQWFWVTSFSTWFGSANPSRIRQMVRDFYQVIPREAAPRLDQHLDRDYPAVPFPETFDTRSARSRALLCVLASHGPRGPDGQPIEFATALWTHGPAALGRVVATASSDLRKSPANRLFSPAPEATGQERNWIVRLDPDNSLHRMILESHAITRPAFDALVARDHDHFLELRQATLMQWEREFMEAHGVTPPTSNASAPAPLDSDVADDSDLDLDLTEDDTQTG